MYAPVAGAVDNILEEDMKLLPAQAGSAFWDEPTVVVASGKPPSVKMQVEDEFSRKSLHSSSPLPKNRVERYACVYPGCSRKFINQAELRNHVEILHQGDQESFQDPDLPYPSTTIEQQETTTETTSDSSHAVHHRSTDHDEDQTVKPIRITAAALEALNLNAEPHSSRATDEESMADSDIHPSSASQMSVETTFSVLDPVDEVAESDVAKPDDPRIKLPVRILLTLWLRFLSDSVGRQRAAQKHHGQYQGSYNQQGSPSQSPSHASSASSNASSSRPGKRKKNQDEEGEGNRRRPPSTRASHGQISPEHMPLACPFNKFDSHTFGGDAGNAAYHVCSTWHDVKTAYLKQHLLRNHCLPQYHCVRCGLDFKNDGELRNHARLPTPCPVKDLDNQKLMPEMQQELGLRVRNAVATNRTDYWYKVYDTIFGLEARQRRPVEPYYKGPSHEIIEAFLHFSEPRMSQVLRQSRQGLSVDPEEYNENNAELVRTILQEASQEFMAVRRASERQSLREIRERNSSSAAASDSGEQTVLQITSNTSATTRPETNPQVWTPARFDLPQQPNMAMFQQSPHSAQFTQGQYYDLPTRTVDSHLSQQQTDTSGYDQSGDFNYSSLTHDGFGIDLNDPEFLATSEDPDMYSGHNVDIHSMDMNNMETFGYHEAPPHRDP